MSSAQTALVTGGAGFIGGHLVARLLALGHRVVVVDDLSTGRLGNLDPAAVLYLADVAHSSIQGVMQQERPSLVFHLAGQVSVSLSTRDPIGDAQSNVLGTLRVLEAARSCGVGKVVYASSGGTLYGDPRSLPCAESDPITPMSPYGTSKFLAEQYLMLYQRLHGLNCTVLRFGNVYGPRQDPHGEAGVVAIFAQAMLEGRETRIFGDGSQERDFVYVDDVVEAFISAIDRGHGEAFNIGSGRGTSVNRIYQLLRGLTGSSREASYCPARPGDVHKIYLECSKARDQLGWTAQTPLEEGLRRTVEYFRRARQGTAQA